MKILIVGCGFIGEIHLKIIKKYNLAEVAILEKDPERRKAISKKYRIEEVYKDFDEALKKGFDGVIICSPYSMHAEHAIKFMGAVKGIMVEKPMAYVLEDAKKKVAAAKKSKSFLLIAYCLRFCEPCIKIKEMITGGDLGNVFSMRASVSSKGALSDPVSGYIRKKEFSRGIIYDYSHEIDYSKWFIGKKVKEIYCKSFNSGYTKWPVFDTADIILKFENNEVSSIHMDYLQASFRRSIEVYGTKGTLIWDNCDYWAPAAEHFKFSSVASAKWHEIKVNSDSEKMYLKQLHHYIKCLNNEEKPMVSGEEGLDLVKIITACVNSVDHGKIVYL